MVTAQQTLFDTSLPVPAAVKVHISGATVTIEGPKGKNSRTFLHPRFIISSAGSELLIKSTMKKPGRNDKMLINTTRAHLRNMVHGVQEGYHAELKVCSGHFPITVTIEGSNVIIKNFLGEKYPRRTSAMPGCKIALQGDQIMVDGLDREAVGQTAARIEQATRITNRDRRIFQDGCYITKKP